MEPHAKEARRDQKKGGKVLCNEPRMKELGMYSQGLYNTLAKFMTDLISHGVKDGWEI